MAQSTLVMELRMVRGGWKALAGLEHVTRDNIVTRDTRPHLSPNMSVTRTWLEVTGVTWCSTSLPRVRIILPGRS